MLFSHRQLPTLLNALYDTGKRTVDIDHPATEVDTLVRLRLEDPFESPVRFPQSLPTYAEARETIERRHGPAARDDLPDDSSFVRCLVASGLLELTNHDEIDAFVDRHGYPDLETGHAPIVVGIDANIMPWGLGDLLNIDHRTGTRDDRGRAATNGYALATGVKSELDWYYKQYETKSLVGAFGTEYERLDN